MLTRYRMKYLAWKTLFRAVFWLAAALAMGRDAAIGAPSGLNIIPTADVYDPGVPSIEIHFEGAGRFFERDCDRFALVQLGVGHGVEMGIDRCLSERNGQPLLNAKMRLHRSEDGRTVLAMGIQNVGRGERAQHYLVAGIGFGRPIRGHVGAIAVEGVSRPMLGADVTWRSCTIQADWVSGRENSSSVGLSWAPTPSLAATFAVLFPNSAGASRGHLLNIQYLIQLARNIGKDES